MGSIIDVTKLELAGIKLIKTRYSQDERGNNTKIFSEEELRENGISFNLKEILLIHSNKNTLRGLHFQRNYSQSRLLSCTGGRLFAALVNINKGNEDFGKSFTYILEQPDEVLFVSKDFALGTLALEDADFICICGKNVFHGESATGIRWNDSDVDIKWPVKDGLVVSDADKKLPRFRDLVKG